MAYKETCRKRARLSKQEKEELESLKTIMAEKGYTDGYYYGDLVVRLEKSSKPKVVIASDKPPAKKKVKKKDDPNAAE